MNMSHETDRIPEPYTPTPDCFERRLREWVRLPADASAIPDAGEANAPPNEHDPHD